MRIHVLSDVHLEFGKWPRSVDVRDIDCDAHVLAGDIGVGMMGLQWALEAFSRPVIYIPGNHEFYGQLPMEKWWQKARAKVAGTHVHLLENESVVIDGVQFLGATLWTDYCLHGEHNQSDMMAYAQQRMTDFTAIFMTRRHGMTMDEIDLRIRRRGDRLTPRRVLEMHQASRAYLENQLTITGDWDRTVVVTHHAPTAKSLMYGEPGNRTDAAYASHLDDLVAKADLWIHGHCHLAKTVNTEGCRVVQNARGYSGNGVVEGFNPKLVVDV